MFKYIFFLFFDLAMGSQYLKISKGPRRLPGNRVGQADTGNMY